MEGISLAISVKLPHTLSLFDQQTPKLMSELNTNTLKPGDILGILNRSSDNPRLRIFVEYLDSSKKSALLAYCINGVGSSITHVKRCTKNLAETHLVKLSEADITAGNYFGGRSQNSTVIRAIAVAFKSARFDYNKWTRRIELSHFGNLSYNLKTDLEKLYPKTESSISVKRTLLDTLPGDVVGINLFTYGLVTRKNAVSADVLIARMLNGNRAELSIINYPLRRELRNDGGSPPINARNSMSCVSGAKGLDLTDITMKLLSYGPIVFETPSTMQNQRARAHAELAKLLGTNEPVDPKDLNPGDLVKQAPHRAPVVYLGTIDSKPTFLHVWDYKTKIGCDVYSGLSATIYRHTEYSKIHASPLIVDAARATPKTLASLLKGGELNEIVPKLDTVPLSLAALVENLERKSEVLGDQNYFSDSVDDPKTPAEEKPGVSKEKPSSTVNHNHHSMIAHHSPTEDDNAKSLSFDNLKDIRSSGKVINFSTKYGTFVKPGINDFIEHYKGPAIDKRILYSEEKTRYSFSKSNPSQAPSRKVVERKPYNRETDLDSLPVIC